MADALASGASIRKDVGVQVPPRPPEDPSSAGVFSRPGTPTSTGLLPEVVGSEVGDPVQPAENLKHLLSSGP